MKLPVCPRHGLDPVHRTSILRLHAVVMRVQQVIFPGGWNTSWPCRPSSTGTRESGVVHGGLRLNAFLLPFFFEEYLGIRIHACGHPRSARCRSNTAATSVTTVPVSVCYGALNLLVRVDASNFVPYACDRAVTGGEYEGPEVPHCRPLVSLAAERSYRTSGTLAPVFPVLGFA